MSTAEGRRAQDRRLQVCAAILARQQYHTWVRRVIQNAPPQTERIEFELPAFEAGATGVPAYMVGFEVARWISSELGHAVSWDRRRPMHFEVRWYSRVDAPVYSPAAPSIPRLPAAIRPAALGTSGPSLRTSAPEPTSFSPPKPAPSSGSAGTSFEERLARFRQRQT